MKPRVRTFLGSNLLIIFLGMYTLLVMRLSVYLNLDDIFLKLMFYAFSGIIWFIPAKYIIKWMQKNRTGYDEDD